MRTSKINLEMEFSVFNPRIFFGSVATAGVLLVGASVPAMAATHHADHHPLKQAHVVSTGTNPVQGIVSTPISGIVTTPAGGLLGALAALPIVGPLFGGATGIVGGAIGSVSGAVGGAAGGNPISNTLHGIGGGGLNSVTSGITNTVGGAIDSITKVVPGANAVTGLLPGGSVTGALNGLTGGITGAVGGVAGSLPKIGG
ncbi:MAG TPA: hypothetical protein VGG16_12670 [Streptosporangiaceae bacterium]